MEDRFDPLAFAHFLHTRWQMAAIAAGSAMILAAGISLILPKKYTSTAIILIEPPAATDARASMTVNPVYLESLKTYEKFALNDQIFRDAATRAHLLDGGEADVEELKRRILKVAKPLSTNLLEISATLGSARGAQDFAAYIARRTIGLSHSLDRETDEDVTKAARELVETAAARLENARMAREAFVRTEPVDNLEEEVNSLDEIRYGVDRDLEESRADLADHLARQQTSSGEANSDAAEEATRDIAALRAKLRTLESRDGEIARSLGSKTALLEQRKARREVLESEEKTARAQLEAANTRLNEIRASSAFRGERLQILNDASLPKRPSSPKLLLNVLAAGIIAVAASFVWLTIVFSRRRFALAPARYEYGMR